MGRNPQCGSYKYDHDDNTGKAFNYSLNREKVFDFLKEELEITNEALEEKDAWKSIIRDLKLNRLLNENNDSEKSNM